MGTEQQVVDAIARSPWKDKVEIRSFMLEQDNSIVAKYGEFEEPAVIINERVKVSKVSADRVLRALQREASRIQ